MRQGIFTLIFIFLFFSSGDYLSAQGRFQTFRSTNNLVFFEMSSHPYASMLQFTLNYERSTSYLEDGKINIRTGYGVYFWLLEKNHIFPISIKYISGKRNHHIEAEAGLQIAFAHSGFKYMMTLPILNIAYRFQPFYPGLFFRIKTGITGFGLGVGFGF